MTSAGGWDRRVADELAAVRAADRWRQPRDVDATGAVTGVVDGRTVVTFASNDYLGLSHHPAVIAAAHAALDRWGAGSGASRLVVGSRPVHSELEAALAGWKGAEDAVLFPTGYAANLGVLATLGGPDVTVLSDELNHASLIDGCRLARARVRVYDHADLDHLAKLLADTDGPAMVVTDSVFSMDGDAVDLPALTQLVAGHDALLVLDEAHAVLGPDLPRATRGTAATSGLAAAAGAPGLGDAVGRGGTGGSAGPDLEPDAGTAGLAAGAGGPGLGDALGRAGTGGSAGPGSKPAAGVAGFGGALGRGGAGRTADTGPEVGPDPAAAAGAGAPVLRVGTLSKVLGSLGGFVVGPRPYVDLLRNRARPFIFTTAPTPADMAAALAAVQIVRSAEGHELRARLRRHVDRLRPGHPSPIIPVILGDEASALAAAAELADDGLLVPAIRPPTVPPGTSRLRVAVSAAHTDAHIGRLLDALGDKVRG